MSVFCQNGGDFYFTPTNKSGFYTGQESTQCLRFNYLSV